MPPAKKVYRPIGETTRGKTAHNRLRRVDNFLLIYAGELIRRKEGLFEQALVVDLGYGAEAFTTLESAARFRTQNPVLPILGVEIVPERVEAAQPYADEKTFFRLGGFNLPLEPGETVRLIRAFNVLRQYNEDELPAAHKLMGSYILPGGLLIEGTSDPLGRIWAANVLRRTETDLVMEGLLFSTNFRWGFEPAIFQPVLPKNFIHHMVPGEKIFTFMEAWKEAARLSISFKALSLRQWFMASARLLKEQGYQIDTHQKYLQRGYLFWKW